MAGHYILLVLYLWPFIVMGRPLYFAAVVSIFFLSFFLLSFFFFPSPNLRAVGDWMSTVFPHMMWP